MRVLFLLKSLTLGGVEVVTATLANRFAKSGIDVSIFVFSSENVVLANRICEDVFVTYGDGYRYSKKNISLIKTILVNKKIDVVINQWGLPFLPIILLRRAKLGLNVKVISVYHNDPMMNGKIQYVRNIKNMSKGYISKKIFSFAEYVVSRFTAMSMSYVYKYSDFYVVLSPCYVEAFSKFTKISNPKKIVVQTNPITIEDSIESAEKKKEIIFVGRIDNQAKRVDRILSIWSLLENKFPDWKLILVGEGCDLNNMKDFAEKLKLTRVSFEGYMNPIEYYKRASILMLMSEFEGFPLVLPECMSAGVIPIVYESFLAVHDIVDDNKNGFIISSAKGFDERLVAERVAVLMSDETLRSSMSIEAMKKSASFSLSKICMQWNELLRSSKKN